MNNRWIAIVISAVVVAGVGAALLKHATSHPPVHTAGVVHDDEDADSLDAQPYFVEERAYPYNQLDWTPYRNLAEREARSASARIRRPPGPTWQYIGPNNMGTTKFPDQRFQGLGPLSGRINALVYDSNGATLYAGSPSGGFWIGNKGGVWTELSDATWPTLAVSCAAQGPTGRVYVGTGDFAGCRPSAPGPMGVMVGYTDFAGWHWANTGAGTFGNRMVSRIVADPDDYKTVIATTGRTTTYSPGVTFNPNLQATGNIWVSRDSGMTWNAASPPAAVYNAVAVGQLSKTTGIRFYYAVGWVPGSVPQVWRSTDRGATWAPTAADPFTAAGNQLGLDVAASATDPNTVYVLSTAERHIWRSTNAGRTWTDITGNLVAVTTVAGYAPTIWEFPDYNYSIACASRKAGANTTDVLYVGLTDVASGTPSGATFNWTWLGRSYATGNAARTHNDDHALAVNPKNPAEVALENDAGIMVLTSPPGGGATTFASANEALRVEEFYNMAFNPTGGQSYFLGGCQDVSLPVLNSGATGFGSTWANAYQVGDGGYCAIDDKTPTNMFAGGIVRGAAMNKMVTFVRSTDAFKTAGNITRVNAPIGMDAAAWVPPITRSVFSGSLYLGATHVYRYRTSDGWTNYSVANTPVAGAGDYIRSLVVSSDGSALYTGSLQGAVFINGPSPSNAWTRVDGAGGNAGTVALPGRPVTSIFVDPGNSKGIWVTLSGAAGAAAGGGVGRVYYCADTTAGAARTWVNMSGGGANTLPDIPVNCLAVVRNRDSVELYAGTDMGVWFSKDGGANWYNGTSTYFLPRVSVRSLSVINGTVYVATYGRGAWSISAGNLTVP